MKLGVFGGTFDPIHLGHLLMAETARESLGLSQVLFTPVGDPPHKQNNIITPARHRRAMTELAIQDNPGFALCTVDLDRPGPHYTADTIRLIRRQYGLAAADFYFIIGGDSLRDLPTWNRPTELVSVCRLAVIHRPGSRPDVAELSKQIDGLSESLVWVEMPLSGLSSTKIRAGASRGQSIRYQTPEPVRAYIEQRGLYKLAR